MSKIKNGGLVQYGAEPFEQQQFGAAGVEGVNKLQHTDDPILRTLFYVPTVKYEIFRLAAKYGLNSVQGSLSAMKDCVWTCSVILGFRFIT